MGAIARTLTGPSARRLDPTLALEGQLSQAVWILRRLLQTDRVVLYRFLPDGDALVTAESVGMGWQSLLGQLIYDPCFEAGWQERYRQGRVQVVTDVQNSGLAVCHAELLTRHQVRANLVVPVLAGEVLWGLLMIHHCQGPRQWQDLEIELVKQVAFQISLAASQVELQQQIQDGQERLVIELQQRTQALNTFRTRLNDIQTILNRVAAAIAYLRIYPHQPVEVEYRSEGCEQIFGFTNQEMLANRDLWRSRIHPEDLAQAVDPAFERLQAEETLTVEYRFYHRDGQLRWIAETLTAWWDAQTSCWVGTTVGIDITARKSTEAALQQQVDREQLLRRMTAHIRESLDLGTILDTAVVEVQKTLQAERVFILQLNNDSSGQVIQQAVAPPYAILDQVWSEECWWAECQAYYQQGRPRIVPDVATDVWRACPVDFLATLGVQSKVVAPIVQSQEASSAKVWGLLIAHACVSHRKWQPVEAELLQQIADQLAIAIQQSELYLQLQQANRDLEQLSTTDALTQVANRRRFDEYLLKEWQRLNRDQAPLALILCDVDYFKLYNDTYGHSAGDVCLAQIAQAIQGAIKRPTDLAARYGGEEFAVVLPNTDVVGAVRVVRLLRQRIRQLKIPHPTSPVQPWVTLSFGVAAAYAATQTTIADLIEAADQALYQAKAQGRDRCCVEPLPRERSDGPGG